MCCSPTRICENKECCKNKEPTDYSVIGRDELLRRIAMLEDELVATRAEMYVWKKAYLSAIKQREG